jgi:hypothetical protein
MHTLRIFTTRLRMNNKTRKDTPIKFYKKYYEYIQGYNAV